MTHQPSLSELVSKYVSAIADAKEGKGYLPIWATDLSLYMGKFRLWFETPMQFWSNYLAEQTLLGSLSPFWKREVIRYVPLRDPDLRTLSATKEYWLQMRLGMHWLLISGAVNIVTFGELDPSILSSLNFALVPNVVLIESHHLFEEDYETTVRKGSHGQTSLLTDFIDSHLPRTKLDTIDPNSQEVFPIYYQVDSFRAKRQSYDYFRHVLARFNWKLQSGICPDCGIDKRHAFDEMELDHVIPVKKGGNNTLLNTEMRCCTHNSEKSKRLSDTKDYGPVAAAIMNTHDIPPGLHPLFSLTDQGISFPVRFHFLPR